ncbi:hypothetical protein L2E82_11307 [Cichorium intybus]|uniref:Uncharacterized protein n=1 Tax=Cichorium intybus TaxID=13427 RepID=A0ACB9GCT1_CICIN|nr:hypothetical protein L2E82_11307 [Cichorium intybus]
MKLLEVKGFDPNGKVKIKNTCSIDLVNSVLEDMLQRARIIHSDEVYFCFGGIDGSQRVQFYSPRNELESLGTDSQSTMRFDMRLEDQEISTSHLTFVDTEVVIPDSYEINDPSLDDIRDVLNPRFSKDQVLQPHKNQQCSSAVDGSNYLMFPENPSRLTTKYFLSLAPPRTLPSEDKFRPFSLGEPTLPPHQQPSSQCIFSFGQQRLMETTMVKKMNILTVDHAGADHAGMQAMQAHDLPFLSKGYATARYKCGKKDKVGAQELILLSAIIKKYRASSKDYSDEAIHPLWEVHQVVDTNLHSNFSLLALGPHLRYAVDERPPNVPPEPILPLVTDFSPSILVRAKYENAGFPRTVKLNLRVAVKKLSLSGSSSPIGLPSGIQDSRIACADGKCSAYKVTAMTDVFIFSRHFD